MPAISAELVKELRQRTNAGMMECKRALEEAGGDLVQAEAVLRKRGVDIAAKRAGRATQEGLVAACIAQGGTLGALIELDCETDFVARNELFVTSSQDLVQWIAETGGLVEDGSRAIDATALDTPYRGTTVGGHITGLVAKTGENIVLARACRFAAPDGRVASYIHHGGKVGVLVEVQAPRAVRERPEFKDVMKDITLQIAAAAPHCLTRAEVPPAQIEAEKEIYRAQIKDKPANILDRIIEGKLRKFYSEICLLDQPFVKDQDLTTGRLLEQKGKELGGAIVVKRFIRFQVGTAPA